LGGFFILLKSKWRIKMIKPTLNEAKAMSKGNNVIPVSMEIFSDVRTSIEILRNIHRRYSKFYILESVESGESWGRYSFLGCDPSVTVTGRDGTIRIENGDAKELYTCSPHELLKELISRYKSPRVEYLPPFTGGFVGYFSYDYIKYVEKSLHLRSNNDEGFDDFCLMLFDKIIAIDHLRQKIHIIVNIDADDLENNYSKAVSTLEDMKRLILSEAATEEPGSGLKSDFEQAFTKAQYCSMVEKAKHYITEGDIFQVVPSNRFTAEFEGDLLQTYRVLRTTNPSPYMFYLSTGDIQIAGASPETLVSLKDGIVSTFPLAGTCKRGENSQEDARLAQELLSNEKELAEHDMLVDLGRNDLGKICGFGTVKVAEYRQIKRFSHVSHIASRVEGRIREDKDAFDAISAVLPAGTLSGAPKLRACEIIDELEGKKRGPYGGAVGYIDFNGNMDFCIGIRMAFLKGGRVYVQSGGGVVADSEGEKEYQESLNKAGAVMEALRNDEGIAF